MQKAVMTFSSSPKSKSIKADNEFNSYVSNFTHDQNVQNKNNLCVYFKRKLLQFQRQKVSCLLLI